MKTIPQTDRIDSQYLKKKNNWTDDEYEDKIIKAKKTMF